MSKLYVGDAGNQVQVAELGLISGKQQMILGDFERDLILRTSGNVQIQVGNKFYPLTYKASAAGSVLVTSTTTILPLDSDLAVLTYPGDGNYVFITGSKSFYIANGGTYIKLNGTTAATIPGAVTTPDVGMYLSYGTDQTLTGAQKLKVVLNSGEVINSFTDVANYTASDVYAGQLIYNIDTKRHYVLNNTSSPAIQSSYNEVYLNLADGGVVLGATTINLTGVNKGLGALHIDGQFTSSTVKSATTSIPVISIGKSDYTSGTAIWSNGGTYLENLEAGETRGFTFLTTNSSFVQKNSLTIYPSYIGMFGNPDTRYNLSVVGTSIFTDTGTFNKGITSDNYSTGVNGTGYTLSIDPNDSKWLLEVDKAIIRDQLLQKTTFYSKSIDGSYWSNPAVKIKAATILDDIDVYCLAAKVGNYTFNGSNYDLIPLTSKLDYALAAIPSDYTVANSAKAVSMIQLPYGVGDRNGSGSVLGVTTYIKDTSGGYSVIPGSYTYDGSNFNSDPAGNYVLTQSINIIFVETENIDLVSIGDFLYYASWTAGGLEDRVIAAMVADITPDGLLLYVYNNERVDEGMELIILAKSGANDGIHFNGIGSGDFIEHLKNVHSFRDVFSNFYTNLEGYEILPINTYKPLTSTTVNKMGDLSNLVDSAYGLNGSNGIGLYSNNAYLKGNFIVDKGTYNNLITTTAIKPFLVINTDSTMQTLDLSARIANWDTAYSWGNHAVAGYAYQARTITATGNGLTGGGNLSADRTFALDYSYLDTRYQAVGAYALQSTTINASGSGIVGGGSLAANRTFALDYTYLDGRYQGVGSYALQSTSITATGNGIVGGGNLSTSSTIGLDFSYLDTRYAAFAPGGGAYIACRGWYLVGNVASPGSSYTATLPINMGGIDYAVHYSLEVNTGTAENSVVTAVMTTNKTSSNFTFYVHESSAITQDLIVHWMVIPY